MKLKQHIFLALIFTALLTLALIAGPGASSGYGGLFFLMISPMVWVAFLLWGFILHALCAKRRWLNNLVAYTLLTLLTIVLVVFCLLTFSTDHDVQSIGYEEIFLDRQLVAIFSIGSFVYGFLFRVFKKA